MRQKIAAMRVIYIISDSSRFVLLILAAFPLSTDLHATFTPHLSHIYSESWLEFQVTLIDSLYASVYSMNDWVTVTQRAKTMSEDKQLSDEQLQEVSGGLNQRFKESREEILNKSAEEEELSEDQLKDVAGGLNERFEKERESTLNKLNERFDESHKDNLNS